MDANQVQTTIQELTKSRELTFADRVRVIEKALFKCTSEQLTEHLASAGVIPEAFGHDSTEEKLYAKYCDALVAASFSALDMTAVTLPDRSEAADVQITSVSGYRVVADAKAFRLSRTAKNQKDFKVEALDQWRAGAEYACLVAPYYQYPNTRSQIYAQAQRYNVTLTSYSHLRFLLSKREPIIAAPEKMEVLWRVGREFHQQPTADEYWTVIRNVILEITGARVEEWESEIASMYLMLPKQAALQIRYLEDVKTHIRSLSHDEAVEKLIKSMKIEEKITVIRRIARRRA